MKWQRFGGVIGLSDDVEVWCVFKEWCLFGLKGSLRSCLDSLLNNA